jgi:hypothetical protein
MYLWDLDCRGMDWNTWYRQTNIMGIYFAPVRCRKEKLKHRVSTRIGEVHYRNVCRLSTPQEEGSNERQEIFERLLPF